MKRYVLEFANDMIRHDKENGLMRPDIREKRKAWIEAILDDYKRGLVSSAEAVMQIARA